MSQRSVPDDIVDFVYERYRAAGLPVEEVVVRDYPGERIVVVHVAERFDEAVALANKIDADIEDGFVTVRKAPRAKSRPRHPSRASVHDARVSDLIELLNARSRTSESQPSLSYVQDASQRLKLALGPRHNLIFGRRGVGKTALMLETKRVVESRGAATLWINVHTLRGQDRQRAFLSVALKMCDVPELQFRGRDQKPASVARAGELRRQAEKLLNSKKVDSNAVILLIPQLQHVLQLFCAEIQGELFIFLDDVHYLSVGEVPGFLDLIHSSIRDTTTWLKVAGVKHQTRWFIADPPTGLQTGHDAIIIDLDVTLEEPSKAKRFLEDVLLGYVKSASLPTYKGFLATSALDRLVLASGGVPRDFLTLCASAIEGARLREKARQTGVQDVNDAAGRAAKVKMQELEGDAAAALGSARALLDGLNDIREFLLSERQINFFRVDFHDKEQKAKEYSLVQGLMDLRMLHIISSGVSARHEAGRRSEVYLLDLSEYSAQRLKRNLRVLDFERDHLVLKRTRSKTPPNHGDSARKLITILRGGPEYPLSRLQKFATNIPITGE